MTSEMTFERIVVTAPMGARFPEGTLFKDLTPDQIRRRANLIEARGGGIHVAKVRLTFKCGEEIQVLMTPAVARATVTTVADEATASAAAVGAAGQHEGVSVVASPAARKAAAEAGLDIAVIAGTGAGGAVTVSDVKRAIASASAAETTDDTSGDETDDLPPA